MKRRTPSLRFSIFLFIIIPVCILISLISFYAVSGIENQIEKYLKEDVEIVARALKRPLSNALKERNLPLVTEIVQSVLEISRLYGAYVYDQNGELILTAGPDRPKGDINKKDLKKKSKETGKYLSLQGRKVYSYTVSLSHHLVQNHIGFLQIVRKRSDIHNQLRGLRVAAITIISIAATLIFLLATVFYKLWIARPLNIINAQLTKLGDGQLSTIKEFSRSREFDLLFSSYNQMTNKMHLAKVENNLRKKEKDELKKILLQKEKLAALGELTAGMAHELGNPLSVVDAQVKRQLRKNDLSANLKEVFNDLKDEVEKMTKIIKDLLSFSRKPNQNISKETIDLSSLLNKISNNFPLIDFNTQTKIDLEGSQLMVKTDPISLNQIITNLVNNALQAVSDQKAPRIRISWKMEGSEYWTLNIEDNGPGIADELKGKIFEPFFTTKRPGKGTGLGLSITHTLITELGGNITVTNSLLGGAKFKISFPREDGI